MSQLRYGPARVPSRESPEAAVELLLERGYTACEIDFEGGFWMDYPWAERFGEVAREGDIALSVHAPIAGFMGHVERDKKQRMAIGMLDHSAGIAVACGAEVVVFHPGFLLGRERAGCARLRVEQLARAPRAARGEGPRGAVRRRGDGPGARARHGRRRGRHRHAGRLGAAGDRLRAHARDVTDGAFTDVEPFADVAGGADEVLEPGAPFHIHFSDIAYANRNETKHLPYGEGTLRAEPLGEALARFERPATVITESPDEESNQAIRAELFVRRCSSVSSASRASKGSASSSRPRSRRN